MMELALAILFGVAIILLILSLFKRDQSGKTEQQIEQFSISFMEEIHQLQNQIRNIELDAEIAAQEPSLQPRSAKQKLLLREVLDLYRRGYSIEGIAAKTELSKDEIEGLLAPYMETRNERRKVANDT